MRMKHSVVGAVLAGFLGALAAVPAPVFAADPTAAPSGAPVPAPAPGPSSITRVQPYVQPSIVYLNIAYKAWIWDKFAKGYLLNGGSITKVVQCTGFVVNSTGYIATAGHCVDPDEIRAHFVAEALSIAQQEGRYLQASPEEARTFDAFIVDGEEPRLAGVRVPTESRGEPQRSILTRWEASVSGLSVGDGVPARLVDFLPFEEGDAALLKVEKSGLNAIQLAPLDDPPVGTELISIGYPVAVDEVTDPNFTPSYKQGTIGKIATVFDGLLKVYEMDAAISGGMSGGPTVDTAGRVLGVNSFKVRGESQPFNFVRPTSIITELMGSQGIDNLVDPVTAQYRAGLDAFFAGDKDRAVEQLLLVTQSQPANPLAQEYLRKARALAGPVTVPVSTEVTAVAGDGGGGGSDTIIIAALAALLVMVLAGGGAFFLKQRPRAAVAGGPAVAGWAPIPAPIPPAPNPPPPVASAPPVCSACSATVPPGQRFCGTCGQPA